MGLIDKLFGSKTTSKSNNGTEILKAQTSHNNYIFKYKQMETEGKIIDWLCVHDTDNPKYPYPCATEAEKRLFECNKYNQLLRGDASNILDAITIYFEGRESGNNSALTVHKDIDKVNYWLQKLLKGAFDGNRSYQAVLIKDWMYSEVWNKNKSFHIEKYQKNLFFDAQNGDPYAQYAVAQFELDGAIEGSTKRKEYLENAAKNGLGDAYYLLAHDFEKNVDMKYGDANSCYFYSLYFKGANTNNGAFVGYMQDLVADCFYDGECGFPKDKIKARQYYNLAAKNGSETALISLKHKTF